MVELRGGNLFIYINGLSCQPGKRGGGVEGCEPKLCGQAATGVETLGWLRLAATCGLEASAAQ